MEVEFEGPQTTKRYKMIANSTEKEPLAQVVSSSRHVHAYHQMPQRMLCTSGSIRGRGTMVFCVLGPGNEKKRQFVKMAWQGRIADHAVVVKRLKTNSYSKGIAGLLEKFSVQVVRTACTSIGTNRGFLDDKTSLVNIETHKLHVSPCGLKRPVEYFWSLHDFIEGLRDALKGHEFLTNIGILHRDINEHNILLGIYPWEERGYLIDFDMAILRDTEEAVSHSSTHFCGQPPQPVDLSATHPQQPDQANYDKEFRFGNAAYISSGVLLGEKDTHFDDVESFLYALLLFLFSYSGPLPKEELQAAHDRGYFRPSGSEPLPHKRFWPFGLSSWTLKSAQLLGETKASSIGDPFTEKGLIENPQAKHSLRDNWPEDFQQAITSLLRKSFETFSRSMQDVAPRRNGTEVSHAQFIKILTDWLEEHAELGRKYSANHPEFKDPRSVEVAPLHVPSIVNQATVCISQE